MGSPDDPTLTMSTLYYILGFVAKLNAGLWRYRINFLPLNVLLLVFMAGGVYAAVSDAIESAHNASAPISVTVAQIHDTPALAQDYVSVTGIDFPVALFQYGDTSTTGQLTSVDKSWSPLLDRSSKRVILVQRAGEVAAGKPHEATVTGMLRELDTEVRNGLAAHHDSIQGVPVETRYMLVVGERPANSIASASVAVLLLVGLGLVLYVSSQRNTIFQRANLGSPISKVKSADPLTVSASGTFGLDRSGKIVEKRFVNMRSLLGRLDDGTPALFSKIDASSRFMGVKMSDRSGIWSLAIVPGSLRDSQVGFFYWGSSRRRPALRFGYTTPAGAQRTAIVSADDMQSLDTAVALLTAASSKADAPVT
jgi:hypothetical protein